MPLFGKSDGGVNIMRKKECQPEREGFGKMPQLLLEPWGDEAQRTAVSSADVCLRAATGRHLQNERVGVLESLAGCWQVPPACG